RRLVSDKFHWRFLGVCVLALGVIAGWLHVRFIASAYQQIAPYSSSGSFFNFEDPWSTVVDNVGRMFSHLCLGQRNCAVGLVILTLIVWAGLYCHRHRNRKLVFPIAFIVAYSTLMISSVGGWTMTSRYWFYALPLVIYYLFKAIELMGGLATKALRLRRALLPLPKFAAIGICVLVLIQLPLIVRSNFVAMYGWGHSREQFYKKFNHGRNAEIMSLVDELAMEKSRAWIATSGKTTILLAFTGRYVHCLGKEPLDVIRSEQWREHPPAVVLLERPKSTDDASDMQVHRQLMDVFGADREHWALDRETERWLVFRRKIGQAQAGR
ncbi:MAG: hypothetical protein QGG25_08410, partial [Phycisphaerae bacterium]|nr:hypothetical protein [Phycisphaerae bacterium]